MKAGGPHTSADNNKELLKDITIEDAINAEILRVPECGECKYCVEDGSIKRLCVKRLVKCKQLLFAVSNTLIIDDPNKLSKAKKGKSLSKKGICFDPSKAIAAKMMKSSSTNAVKKSTISSKKSPSIKSLVKKAP